METIRNWLLPVLLAALQVAWLWPGAFLMDHQVPDPVALAGVLAAVTVETVALGRRRRAPVQALLGTLGASVLGQAVSYDDYADLGLLFALYSVAARCPASVTLRAVAAGIGSTWLLSALRHGFHAAFATDAAISASVYVICVGLGEARRQWLTRRLAAARRLAGAEDRKRQAADTERRRLARELHDVSAHHLTSVVVTVDAARRLGGSRPELTAEALGFAERTGHETLTAIQRLVAVMRSADLPASRPMTREIQELVAGFGRLGRPIAIDVPGDLAGPAAEAVHGIVREALTNALRYAPGAAVRIHVHRADGALELAVDNDAPRATAQYGGSDLGSGRGLAGMRERAAAVGGELTAGPGPDGGWHVRATLPDTTGPRQPGVRSRRRDFPREQRLADSALAFSAAVLPLSIMLANAEDWKDRGGVTGALAIAVLAGLLALHALPLLWRRRAPWAALAGVLAASWLWPLACAGAVVPSRVSQFLAGGVLAEVLAVYALAAYGRGAAWTWPSVFAAAWTVTGALTVTAAADGDLAGDAASWQTMVVIIVPMGLLMCPLYALMWGVGLAVRSRRLSVLARDDWALAHSAWQAETAAEAERRRLAARLSDAVVRRTAALVELARQGRLDDVAAAARSALAAMRELLHSLGDGEAPERRLAPQPTAADLDTLCRTLRAAGRDVTLRGMPEAAAGLPASVALSAYRVVEAALGAGDRGPARVTLRRRRDALNITVAGVPLAVAGPVAERLRVQATAGEGRITFEPAGTVRMLLPLLAEPRSAPAQEVSPSPYA
ncbi:histidine kinase [Streptomyces avermitilis]|uniref:histidine kinase n=1 Tax=Streptomyces avermitilis TaxID=33903 RepID=UPI0033AE05BD